MAEISKVRRCYNCGAILQCEHPSKEGYVKKEVLENATQNFLFCDKCFELERFKERSNEPLLDPDFLTLLNDAKKKGSLIVYVVNLFSFEAAFNHQINEILEGMNILVVGNKFDLLPAKTSKELTKEYVAHRFRAAGLTIHSENVIVANAFDDETAREIMTRIYELKNGKDVYLVGSQLSGKSTLLSSFLRVFNNLSKGNIVTEPYKNTDLSVMKIPLSTKSNLYNTPGISLDNSILYNLDKATMREIWITKSVKPREVTLSRKQCMLIGGMAIIELVSGKKTTFSCYFHEHIKFKKHHNKESLPIDERFVKMISKKSLKPALSYIKSVKDLDVYDVVVTESNQRDIGILGLGWVSFEANKQTIRVYVPKNVSMYHSRSKILIKKKK